MKKSTAAAWLVNRNFLESHTTLARALLLDDNILKEADNMERHHAIIFDFDGTLVDSLRDITDALNAALADLALRAVTEREARSWVGDGLLVLCRRALPAGGETLAEDLARLTRKHYHAHPARHTRPYPNILKMLDLLQAARVPMAVLSNKPHDLTAQVVAQLGLTSYFAEVVGCRSEEDKKPAPAGALRLARRLGVEPAAVLLVGDSVVDVETARNAGMSSVAVTWGFRDRDELLAAQPDHLVADPLEIPLWLKR